MTIEPTTISFESMMIFVSVAIGLFLIVIGIMMIGEDNRRIQQEQQRQAEMQRLAAMPQDTDDNSVMGFVLIIIAAIIFVLAYTV